LVAFAPALAHLVAEGLDLLGRGRLPVAEGAAAVGAAVTIGAGAGAATGVAGVAEMTGVRRGSFTGWPAFSTMRVSAAASKPTIVTGRLAGTSPSAIQADCFVMEL
jgi:hypothetical protein